MTVTNHVLTGAVVALAVNNPYAAVAIAFVSHFVLDAIPHFGPSQPKDVFERNKNLSFQLMLIGSILVTVILLPIIYSWAEGVISFWRLTICILAANLPDLVWVPRFISEIITHKEKPRGPFSEMHVRLQRDSLTLGAATESLWFVVMLVSLIILTQ